MRKPLTLDELATVREELHRRRGRRKPLPFADYAERPVDFIREVLGVELWDHQKRAVEAVLQHRRVAWRSSHGVGKSMTVASLAVWFVETQPGAVVVLSAPTARQVRAVLWRSVTSLAKNAAQPLGGELHASPEFGWQFDDGRLVVGFSTDSPEKLAGFHAPNLLAIIDEASGVPAGIFESLKGALTGAGRLLLTGNPTRTSGEFFDSFGRKSALYHCLHTSGYDVPGVSEGDEREPVPGLMDRQTMQEMADDYGPDSSIFAVRCLGEFPKESADSVIPLSLVETARQRWDEFMSNHKFDSSLGALEVGVDPARFGADESVIVVRRGHVAIAPIVARGLDVTALAAKVGNVVAQSVQTGERALVRVDSVGVGGGVADILRRDYRGTMRVIDINAGAVAYSDSYQRCRDELWFTLRDWLRDGGMLPPDTKLEGDLIAPSFTYSAAQKLIVESKDDIKKRLRRSPDRADALALAVYEPKIVSRLTAFTIGKGPFAARVTHGPTDTFGRPVYQ